MTSEVDVALGTQITGESAQLVAKSLRCLTKQWSEDVDSLSGAVSQAVALRQAIAAQQQGVNGTQLWPGPVTNPLARLHIIILEKDGINNLENLKVCF